MIADLLDFVRAAWSAPAAYKGELLAMVAVLLSPLWLVAFAIVRSRRDAPRTAAWRAMAAARGWQVPELYAFAGTLAGLRWEWALEDDHSIEAFRVNGLHPERTLRLIPRAQADAWARRRGTSSPSMGRLLARAFFSDGPPDGVRVLDIGSSAFTAHTAVLGTDEQWSRDVVDGRVQEAWLAASPSTPRRELEAVLARGTLRIWRSHRQIDAAAVVRDVDAALALLDALVRHGAGAPPGRRS